MKFRPLLWPTIVTIPALIVLLMLGTWQVNRLQWKTALIDEFKARSTAEAIYPSFQSAAVEFQRVSLEGRFLHDETVYLTGRTYEGNAGFHVVTAFESAKGDIFFVNRGWVSEAYHNIVTVDALTGGVSATFGISDKHTSATVGQFLVTSSCVAASLASTSKPVPEPAVSLAYISAI